MNDFARETPRIVVTAVILLLFGYGVAFHWGTGIEETLKNVTLLAVGFWLGSSKGAADSGVRTDKALDIAASAQAANATTDTPQPVTVVNRSDDPVPTTEATT